MTSPASDTYFTRLLAAKSAPLLIAGPCSAETEEQVLLTARRLKVLGNIDIVSGWRLEAPHPTGLI